MSKKLDDSIEVQGVKMRRLKNYDADAKSMSLHYDDGRVEHLGPGEIQFFATEEAANTIEFIEKICEMAEEERPEE